MPSFFSLVDFAYDSDSREEVPAWLSMGHLAGERKGNQLTFPPIISNWKKSFPKENNDSSRWEKWLLGKHKTRTVHYTTW